MRVHPISLITLGDSLTGTYAGESYGGAHHSWTDLLCAYRADHLSLHNLARAGSTTADLLAQGQHTAAARLLERGEALYATLAIGANDIGAFVGQVDLSRPETLDPGRWASALLDNIETAVTILTAAGARLVLANVPNVAETPSLRPFISTVPPVGWLLATFLDRVNARIAALAAARSLPLLDLCGLHALSGGTLRLGGVNVQQLLHCDDGFHPSAVGSGLLANAQLQALWSAYGIDVPRFNDADLLRLAGLSPTDHSALFDVSRFVVPPRRQPGEAA